METFALHRGTTPLFISLPHDGTDVPADIAARLTDSARGVPDTDWFVSRLYDFARGLGASIIVPRHSRYVVDLNRPPDDVSLYPGQNTTGLCPIVQFSGEPVYLPGQEPSEHEVHERVARYWQPYHAALAEEITRLRAQHGRAVLWEGHSIRAVVPFLFNGRLPDFNLGTANGNSCRPETQARLAAVLAGQSRFTSVVNGRFKGGHITREYGNPSTGVEAIQLELAQTTYMDADEREYDAGKAAATQDLIGKLLAAALGEG